MSFLGLQEGIYGYRRPHTWGNHLHNLRELQVCYPTNHDAVFTHNFSALETVLRISLVGQCWRVALQCRVGPTTTTHRRRHRWSRRLWSDEGIRIVSRNAIYLTNYVITRSGTLFPPVYYFFTDIFWLGLRFIQANDITDFTHQAELSILCTARFAEFGITGLLLLPRFHDWKY